MWHFVPVHVKWSTIDDLHDLLQQSRSFGALCCGLYVRKLQSMIMWQSSEHAKPECSCFWNHLNFDKETLSFVHYLLVIIVQCSCQSGRFMCLVSSCVVQMNQHQVISPYILDLGPPGHLTSQASFNPSNGLLSLYTAFSSQLRV